jgi:D-methionine transport system substrate-binding protein
MKKYLLFAIALVFTIGNQAFAKNVKLRLGLNSGPTVDIFNSIKKDLAKDGVDLELVEFGDYKTPNLSLEDKSIDANAYQTSQYLKNFNENNKTHIVKYPGGDTWIAPYAVYSKKIKNIKDLKKGDRVGVPNDPANENRALKILEQNGIIKIKPDAGELATVADIIDNPKNIEFKEIDAAQLPRTLDEFTASFVNASYAVEAGLNILKDAILIEDAKTSKYGNFIAVRAGDEKDERVAKLVKHLQTKQVKAYILKDWKGALVPIW